jgi:hypothetical protein
MSKAVGRTRSTARVCTILGFVFAAIAVVFFPIVFGLVAIVLAIVGYNLGDRDLGKWAIIAAVAGTVLGLLLGYLAWA